MRRHPPFSLFVLILPLLWLWWLLIDHLRVEWSVNPQYTFGWAVPFLCGYLVWRKLEKTETVKVGNKKHAPAESKPDFKFSVFSFLIVGMLVLAFAPTRLVQEANPDWRLVSWALAFEVIGITLLLVYLTFGAGMFARVAFPIVYFLVAVPWPIPLVEQPVIQGLTRLDARVCTELFGWLGIPVIAHGNVFELANGMVGIDEACSGIRSFQATLMISLFLGELYRLNIGRRIGLVLAGFTLSFFFNAARMSLLVWVAARKGVSAIAAWHDPAGVTILLGCFLGLWWLGTWLGKKKKTETLKLPQTVQELSIFSLKLSTPLIRFAIGLCVWLAVVEISVQWWYRSHAAHLPPAVQWAIDWPTTAPGFKELPVPEAARQILRYDEGRSATWSEDGRDWQAVYLRWEPRRTAVHLANNHTPNVCLTAAGHTLKIISPEVWLEVNGLRLPFSVNQVMDSPKPLFVYYCLWDDRNNTQRLETMDLNHRNRLTPVLAGLRNPGQRSLEILVAGPETPAIAETVVLAELQKLVQRQ